MLLTTMEKKQGMEFVKTNIAVMEMNTFHFVGIIVPSNTFSRRSRSAGVGPLLGSTALIHAKMSECVSGICPFHHH